MASRPFLRIAPWLILLVAAYALGRWQGGHGRTASPNSPVANAPAQDATEMVEPSVADGSVEETRETEVDRAVRIVAKLDAVALAAKSMPVPDADTYAFFENLAIADLEPVISRIEGMPPGNEQDVLFIMTVRRWAQLDGDAAVARASGFPALGTRTNARLAAFESWGAIDGDSALSAALASDDADAQARDIAAVVTGAATKDPAKAVALFESTPESYRESPAASVAAVQIASGAFGTGKGEAVREIIANLPESALRAQMIETVASEWGAHHPDEALLWLSEVAPEGEARDTAVNSLFLSLVQKDPALAAVWSTDYPDDNRRTSYIAASVQSWARLDAPAAETWVNEQPSGRYLDGAGYAMAAHFMARRDMGKSFSWIRRINTVEMRAELLGALGRMWANEKPEAFKNFLDQTSLNRAEVEMLLAKIPPAT